jgi:hypothetical protein
MQIATHSGLGIPSNEMQRSINGFGHHYPHVQAGGTYDSRTTPYGYWRPYHPNDARGQFGDVPNDFEASVDLQYIPVRQGWYYGRPVDGRGYPDVRGGLGADAPATAEEALKQLAKTERLQAILQVISTLSIATVATLALVRAIRSRRGGDNHRFFGEDD